MGKPNGPSVKLHMKSFAQNAILVATGVLVAVLASEGVLRSTTPRGFLQRPYQQFEWMAYDPVNSWTNRADFQSEAVAALGSRFAGSIRINALGLRGDEIAQIKAADTSRIVCMGDSGTFGLWVASGKWLAPGSELRFDNDYPRYLGALIQTKRLHAEVINAGVVGYSSSHGVRQLMTQILDLDPDVLTVRYGFNDYILASNAALRAMEPSDPFSRALLYRFPDWRLTRLGWNAYERITGLHPDPFSVPWASLEQFERNLRQFIDVSRRRNIHLLFIDYPLRPLGRGTDPDDAYLRFLRVAASVREFLDTHRTYQSVLQRTAQAEGIPLLVTAGALEQPEVHAFGPADMIHPNDAGAQLIAELLLAKLSELGWVR